MFDIICFALAIIYHANQVRIHYNRQLQERINDLNVLAESEQLSAKALSMSKQAVLNLAATAHDLQQPLSAMQLLLSLQNSADPTIQNVQGALNYACSLLNSALAPPAGLSNLCRISRWAQSAERRPGPPPGSL